MSLLPSRLHAFALALSAALTLLLAVGEASAQTRVVVENFHGPQSGRVRGYVVQALSNEGSIEIVPRAEVEAAAAELGLRANRLREDDYPQIAQQLNVTAFVKGRVSRRRRRWSAVVTVINGADGATLGRERWGGRTVSSLGAIRRNGYRRLEPHLSSAQSPGPASNQNDNAQANPNHWAYGGAENDEGYDDEEIPGEEDEEEEDSEPVDPGSAFDFLTIELLGGFLHRGMTANARVLNNGRDPMGPAELDEVRSYTSAGLGGGEVGFRMGFFPGAIPDDQPIPWFGAIFELRHSVGLTSRGCPQTGPCTTDQDRIDVGTEQWAMYVGAQGRFRFGDKRGAPMIWADVGYGIFGFLLDPGALMQLERPSVIPPIQYSYIHLGGGINYALVPIYFTAGLRLGYNAGLDVGQNARDIWGLQTGGSSGFQLGIDLTTEMPYIAEGVFLGLSFEYFVFSTAWRGQTRCVDPSTGCSPTDPWEPWPSDPADPDVVTGGIQDPVNDNYIRLYLSIGYAFR